MRLISKHLSTILIALAVSAVAAAGPAIAHGVEHALFAHDSAKLGGVSSARYVQGRPSSQVVAVRRVVPNDTTITLYKVPGMGRLRAFCLPDGNNARVRYDNNSGTGIDVWSDYDVATGLDAFRKPSGGGLVDVAWFEVASDTSKGGRLILGEGTGGGTPGSGRTAASLDVVAFKAAGPAPCAFQVHGTLWRE